MWYKLALTEIEPTGQLVLPGMTSGINLDQLRFEYKKNENQYTIFAYYPRREEAIGGLIFSYKPESNSIYIDMIQVNDFNFEYPNIKTHPMNEILSLDNDDFEQLSMKFTGKGIAGKLYEKMVEIIHNDPVLVNANYIQGDVFSAQALRAKNRVLGEPVLAGAGVEFKELYDIFMIYDEEISKLQYLFNDPEYKNTSPETKLFFEKKLAVLQEKKDEVLQLLNNLGVNPQTILDKLKFSEDGRLGAESNEDVISTYHKIPLKLQNENKTEKTKVIDGNQKRLEI